MRWVAHNGHKATVRGRTLNVRKQSTNRLPAVQPWVSVRDSSRSDQQWIPIRSWWALRMRSSGGPQFMHQAPLDATQFACRGQRRTTASARRKRRIAKAGEVRFYLPCAARSIRCVSNRYGMAYQPAGDCQPSRRITQSPKKRRYSATLGSVLLKVRATSGLPLRNELR